MFFPFPMESLKEICYSQVITHEKRKQPELYLQNFVWNVTSVNNGILVTQNTRVFKVNGVSDNDNWKGKTTQIYV